MKKIFLLYKPLGLTPLDMIKLLKLQKPELTNQKITYAGRLDPLAHGVLLLLTGEEIKNKEKYLSLRKEYEFEVLFGIETDTYDVLGLISKNNITRVSENVNLIVNAFVNNSVGKQLQHYPAYSSKTVNGKPLFWWARNNKLEEITIPTHPIEIFSMRLLGIEEISLSKFKKQVEQSVNAVRGDFRQKHILSHWKKLFADEKNKTKTLKTATLVIKCSSGTYVRELVHQLGKEIGCGAIAIDIKRTAIGDYKLKDALNLMGPIVYKIGNSFSSH